MENWESRHIPDLISLKSSVILKCNAGDLLNYEIAINLTWITREASGLTKMVGFSISSMN